MVIMIILLILCLPLILMLSLFTTTEVVSIMVDVPVRGIDVVVEELVELDLDRGESFAVDYVISPTEAANTDVVFYFHTLGDAKLADFTVDGNVITPTSYGSARVIVETVDGGYRDSFDVVVYSKRVESIHSTLDKTELTIGETAKILTSYYPTVVRDEGLAYRVVEGEDVVTVSSTGTVRATGIGTAVIEVTSRDNPEARSLLTVSAVSSGVIDLVSDRCDITALVNTAELKTVINPDVTVLDYTISLYCTADGSQLGSDIAVAHLDTATGVIVCRFIDEAFVGDVELVLNVITTDGDETVRAYVHRISEIEIGWADTASDGRYDVLYSDSDGVRIEIALRPLGADVSYLVTLNYTETDTDDVGVGSLYFGAGQEFELRGDTRIYAIGGFISIELEESADGVFLIVRGERSPSLEDIDSGITATEIKLTVVNNHDGTVTVLDTVSVTVY